MGQSDIRSDGLSSVVCRARLGVHYKLLVGAYVVAVVLFNRASDISLAFPKILAFALMFAFLVELIGNKRTLQVPMTYRIWIIWFFVALVTALLADDVRLGRIVTLAQLSIVGLVVTNLLIWNRDVRFYMAALLIAAVASSLWILYDPGGFTVGPRTAISWHNR
jgi:hypothetical protein